MLISANFWDYMVAPGDGAMRLRVTTPPLEIYQVGESACARVRSEADDADIIGRNPKTCPRRLSQPADLARVMH